jgi:hypothetical protein
MVIQERLPSLKSAIDSFGKLPLSDQIKKFDKILYNLSINTFSNYDNLKRHVEINLDNMLYREKSPYVSKYAETSSIVVLSFRHQNLYTNSDFNKKDVQKLVSN